MKRGLIGEPRGFLDALSSLGSPLRIYLKQTTFQASQITAGERMYRGGGSMLSFGGEGN